VPRPVRCDVDPGVGLPRAVLRRLGCDGLIRALLADAQGNPLALGRRNRLPTRKVRDAIYARDRGTCQYPGCDRTRWLQIHHLDHWADHGDTDPDNLALMCTAHHHAIHDENITLRRAADGTIIALVPDGRILRPAPRLDPGEQPVRDLADATRHVTRTAIIPDWGGEPLSLDYSLHILAQHQPDKQRSDAAAA
jgi:hypothetical protein